MGDHRPVRADQPRAISVALGIQALFFLSPRKKLFLWKKTKHLTQMLKGLLETGSLGFPLVSLEGWRPPLKALKPACGPFSERPTQK